MQASMGSASISDEVEGVKERALAASIWGFDGASQTAALLEIEFSSFDGGHHNKRASRSGRRRWLGRSAKRLIVS